MEDAEVIREKVDGAEDVEGEERAPNIRRMVKGCRFSILRYKGSLSWRSRNNLKISASMVP